jgi:hypothetical protein
MARIVASDSVVRRAMTKMGYLRPNNFSISASFNST